MGWCSFTFALRKPGNAGRDELIAYLDHWKAGHARPRRYVKVGFEGVGHFVIRFMSEGDRNHAKLGW